MFLRNASWLCQSSLHTVRPIISNKQNQHISICCSQNSNTYDWDLTRKGYNENDKKVKEIKLKDIRRPLQRSRTNDQDKVEALKRSISTHGLLEPIDVLEVDGVYYGFSGCHRFQAHQELGKEKILCKVRKATKQTLKFHLM